jgi:hypothetical protein
VPEVAVAVGHGGERGVVVGWSGGRREKVERLREGMKPVKVRGSHGCGRRCSPHFLARNGS